MRMIPTEHTLSGLAYTLFCQAGWKFTDAKNPYQIGGNWWCCLLSDDGKLLEYAYPKTYLMAGAANVIEQPRRAYAFDICRYLNAQCSHGGAWIAAWIDDAREFYLVWKDADGDFQVPIECDLNWEQIQFWTVDDWAEHAEQAYTAWKEHLYRLQLKKSQLIKAAQGERHC